MNPEQNNNTEEKPPEPESFVGRAWLLLPLYLVCYVPGLVCNIVWLRRAVKLRRVKRRSPKGLGSLVIMLIVLGIASPLLVILACLAIGTIAREFGMHRVHLVHRDLRMYADAIEAYYLDHGVYPAHTFDRRKSAGSESAEEFTREYGQIPTFRTRGDTELATLTTPTAYLIELHWDHSLTSDFRYHSFAYWTDGGGWIVWSPGLDGRYAITDPSEVYSSDEPQPSDALLHRTYDPTNGSISPGDIWRIRD